jgi:hypothetical protein
MVKFVKDEKTKVGVLCAHSSYILTKTARHTIATSVDMYMGRDNKLVLSGPTNLESKKADCARGHVCKSEEK